MVVDTFNNHGGVNKALGPQHLLARVLEYGLVGLRDGHLEHDSWEPFRIVRGSATTKVASEIFMAIPFRSRGGVGKTSEVLVLMSTKCDLEWASSRSSFSSLSC